MKYKLENLKKIKLISGCVSGVDDFLTIDAPKKHYKRILKILTEVFKITGNTILDISGGGKRDKDNYGDWIIETDFKYDDYEYLDEYIRKVKIKKLLGV